MPEDAAGKWGFPLNRMPVQYVGACLPAVYSQAYVPLQVFLLENPNPSAFQGWINFDNLAYSMLALVQVLTQEGMSDIMCVPFRSQRDAFAPHSGGPKRFRTCAFGHAFDRY
jgi:hypothetical protein